MTPPFLAAVGLGWFRRRRVERARRGDQISLKMLKFASDHQLFIPPLQIKRQTSNVSQLVSILSIPIVIALRLVLGIHAGPGDDLIAVLFLGGVNDSWASGSTSPLYDEIKAAAVHRRGAR
jgi:hypothetical protein